jgi:hypothetical protein
MSGRDKPIAGHIESYRANNCSFAGPAGEPLRGVGGLPNYVTLYVANCKTCRVRWLSGSRRSSTPRSLMRRCPEIAQPRQDFALISWASARLWGFCIIVK